MEKMIIFSALAVLGAIALCLGYIPVSEGGLLLGFGLILVAFSRVMQKTVKRS